VAGKIIHSFIWDFGGRIGNQLVSFIIGILLARILSPAEFGLIGMSLVFISISEIFTNLGLSAALVQRLNINEEHYSSSFYLNVFAAGLLTLLFIALAPAIALFFKTKEITAIIRTLSLSLLISSFAVVQEARLRKFMRFNILAKARIVSSVLSGITGITMALAGLGVWSLVIQNLLGRTITTAYYWLATSWKPKLLFRFRAIKELWSYGFNMFISGLIDRAYSQLDSIIIARIFSPTDLGLYTRAKSLNRFVIQYSSESIGSVTFPAMAAIQEERKRMIELGLKAETLIAFVSFGLLGLLFVTAGPLILTLLGPKWEASISIYKILCLSGFAYPVSSATLSMLRASGDSGSFLKVEVWKKIVGLAGLSIGFLYGMKGFLISLIFTGAISVLMNMYVTGKSVGISVAHQLSVIIKYLVIALLAAMFTSILPLHFVWHVIDLVILALIFSILYVGINHMLKTPGLTLFITELREITKKIKMNFPIKK